MLNFRKAQIEDCQCIYDLRNDPQVRTFSFTGDAIPYEAHTKWFEASLVNPNRRIFLVVEEEAILGVVRFDLSNDFTSAVVSINVSPKAWGKGIGSYALYEGEKKVKEEFIHLTTLIANVMDKNEASKKLFQKCDYRPRMIEFSKEVK